LDSVNPLQSHLQPYPFERLRALVAGIVPPASAPIQLSIGEPRHPTPSLIRDALVAHLDGLSVYPATAGLDALRDTVAAWFQRRYRLPHLDAQTEVLPVNGTREALFAIAQSVVDSSRRSPTVASPNPFYQIYEGAALLAGATPLFLNDDRRRVCPRPRLHLPRAVSRVQLLYICSPGNPTGRVLTLDEWCAVFELSDRHGFVIASDECYSDIYNDEVHPPIGGLEACQSLGRNGFKNLVVFVSLSKRSNAPGLRSGAVAGDANLIRQFLLYRTYHGCAMSIAVQHASVAAWSDEAHVRGESGALPREVRRCGADAELGAARAEARRRLLSLGTGTEETMDLRPRTVCRDARHRAAGSVSRPDCPRRESRTGIRSDRPGARVERLR
jgi:N-succinyldiaminopimelate aminotransferase